MNKAFKLAIIIGCAVTFSGCSSNFTTQVKPTEPNVPVQPQPFNDTHSIAYNIANQTDLTQDYAWGGRIYSSPLKDFTQTEVDSIQAKVNENLPDGGEAGRFLGTMDILRGKLIGVISVAGGSLNALSWNPEQHPAISSRWIVSVDASKYANEEAAKADIVNNITTAILGEYSKYGFKYKEKIINKNLVFYATDTEIPVMIGGAHNININDKVVEPAAHQSVNFNNEAFESYSIGLRGAYGYNKTINIINLGLFMRKDIVGDDTFDQFIKRVTKRLPENYFYYQSSFPQFRFEGKSYIQSSIVVPAIYTQGKRYDFIKSE